MGRNNHLTVEKLGYPHQGPRAGQAVRDSHSEGGGSTHSELLLDHAGRGRNGAGRVMLHHLRELCQVSLHELQGFGGLWEDKRRTTEPAGSTTLRSCFLSFFHLRQTHGKLRWCGKPRHRNNACLSQVHDLGLPSSSVQRDFLLLW